MVMRPEYFKASHYASSVRPASRGRGRVQQGESRSRQGYLNKGGFRTFSAEEGEKRLERIVRQLQHDHNPAARSLREGMKENFHLASG
jgi:hypothetical protein